MRHLASMSYRRRLPIKVNIYVKQPGWLLFLNGFKTELILIHYKYSNSSNLHINFIINQSEYVPITPNEQILSQIWITIFDGIYQSKFYVS